MKTSAKEYMLDYHHDQL